LKFPYSKLPTASDVRVSTKLAFVQRVPNLNNYNAGGNAQGTNVVDPHLFFHDDLDFPSEHNYFLNNVKIFSDFHIIQTMSMEHSFCMRQVRFMDHLMGGNGLA
jgi:hypothetical protein